MNIPRIECNVNHLSWLLSNNLIHQESHHRKCLVLDDLYNKVVNYKTKIRLK